jgi:hypothetical protein
MKLFPRLETHWKHVNSTPARRHSERSAQKAPPTGSAGASANAPGRNSAVSRRLWMAASVLVAVGMATVPDIHAE